MKIKLVLSTGKEIELTEGEYEELKRKHETCSEMEAIANMLNRLAAKK